MREAVKHGMFRLGIFVFIAALAAIATRFAHAEPLSGSPEEGLAPENGDGNGADSVDAPSIRAQWECVARPALGPSFIGLGKTMAKASRSAEKNCLSHGHKACVVIWCQLQASL